MQGLDRSKKQRRGLDRAMLKDKPLSPTQESLLITKKKAVPSLGTFISL
jgi:hypothetical protein